MYSIFSNSGLLLSSERQWRNTSIIILFQASYGLFWPTLFLLFRNEDFVSPRVLEGPWSAQLAYLPLIYTHIWVCITIQLYVLCRILVKHEVICFFEALSKDLGVICPPPPSVLTAHSFLQLEPPSATQFLTLYHLHLFMFLSRIPPLQIYDLFILSFLLWLSEDLELATTSEREHLVFLFLQQGYLIQYNMVWIGPLWT